MNLKRLLQWLKKQKNPPARSDFSSASFREMERVLNQALIELFQGYQTQLLKEPPLYLVPAVWGEKTTGELDRTQKEMYRVLSPVLEAIQQRLVKNEARFNGCSDVEYLVKSVCLYKMAYMIQYYLNCKGSPDGGSDEIPGLLADMEPAGRA